MKTGHVEKTNDRDYEVEERYGVPNALENAADPRQTIPHNGGCLKPPAEGSKRILGFVAR